MHSQRSLTRKSCPVQEQGIAAGGKVPTSSAGASGQDQVWLCCVLSIKHIYDRSSWLQSHKHRLPCKGLQSCCGQHVAALH